MALCSLRLSSICCRLYSSSLPLMRALAARKQSTFGSNNFNVEITDKIATVKMVKSPANTLDTVFYEEFITMLDSLEQCCRGMVLTSGFPNVFCAGLNLVHISKFKTFEEMIDFGLGLEKFWLRLYSSKLAVVAAINGHAIAGGCAIALACDYRVMATSNKPGKIGLNEVKLGMMLPYWLTEAFTNAIGTRNADLHSQLGTLFSPEDAAKIGLVDKVVSSNELMDAAHKKVEELLSSPDSSRYACKMALRNSIVAKKETIGKEETEKFAKLFISPQSRQALQQAVQQLMSRA